MGDNKENLQTYPTMLASSHNRGSWQETKFRRLEIETCSLAWRISLRRSLDLICILEAYHLTGEETVIIRQLVLTCQGPGESIVSYINQWLEMAH